MRSATCPAACGCSTEHTTRRKRHEGLSRQSAGAISERRSDTFTGVVWADPVMPATNGVTINNVLFEPGARTYWHTHEFGQVLQVTAGQWLDLSGRREPQPIRQGDIGVDRDRTSGTGTARAKTATWSTPRRRSARHDVAGRGGRAQDYPACRGLLAPITSARMRGGARITTGWPPHAQTIIQPYFHSREESRHDLQKCRSRICRAFATNSSTWHGKASEWDSMLRLDPVSSKPMPEVRGRAAGKRIICRTRSRRSLPLPPMPLRRTCIAQAFTSICASRWPTAPHVRS
jgi:hypothetical protein